MDDRIAISRIKQGDLNALETLVKRYQAQAVHAAYLILYERAAAEDVAQGAFVKVVERIRQYDVERPFAPWFFRIVLNDALKTAKKQKRQVSLEEFDEPAVLLGEWLVQPDSAPEQMVERQQMEDRLLEAIRSLPPDQRAVIVMRYFLDLSDADMVEKLERPLSTIKWWLRDARKRLYDLMSNSR